MTTPLAEYDDGNTLRSAMTAFQSHFDQGVKISQSAFATVSQHITIVDTLLVALGHAPQNLTQCQDQTNLALCNAENSFETLASLLATISAEGDSESVATWAREQWNLIQGSRHLIQERQTQLTEKQDELNALLGEAMLSLPCTTSVPVDLFDQIGRDTTGATEAYDQYTL